MVTNMEPTISPSINLSSTFVNDDLNINIKKRETASSETEVDEHTVTTVGTMDHHYYHSSIDNDGSFRTNSTPLHSSTIINDDSEILIASPTISIHKSSHHNNSQRSSKIRVVDTLRTEIDQVLYQQEDCRPLNANLESLTINKLHHDAVGMIGREPELKLLESCFAKLVASQSSNSSSPLFRYNKTLTMMNRPSFAVQNSSRSNFFALDDGPSKQLVWIKGYSGSGKSTLAKSLEALVGETEQGLLIEGKYDQKHSNEPCSGILAAFGQIFQYLAHIQLITDTATNIVDQLVLALGDEKFDLLVDMIPYLEEVVRKIQSSSLDINDGESSLTSLSESSSSHHRDLQYGFGAQQESIKYAFRILTRVLSSYFHPLVIILDDLQWSDLLSLDVLDCLMTDKQNFNSVMFVGCYRSNEVYHGHILTEAIRRLSTKSDSCNFEMTYVEVGNFSVSSVNQVIRKMIAMDDDETTVTATAGLAKLCHRRTLGNPHFVIQFMTMLYDEGLLTYNLGLLKWKWDEQEIEKVTMSTDNVVDILKARMKKLSPELQLVLKCAACLGASFHKDRLDLVYSEHSGVRREIAELTSTGSFLEKLEENNYVECMDGTVYVWVHDKIQEAALELIGESKGAFQFEVGCILYKSSDKTILEESLFNVVDLINQGNVKRRFDFAELNLRAARKAKGLSAFHSAASYVRHGIELLPHEKWTANFQLTLKLYILGAHVELAIGNGQAMEQYYREVISQKHCSTMDKLPLYVSKIDKLSSIDIQFKQCIAFILDILKKLGCNLVSNKSTARFQAIRSFRKTSDMVKKLPKDFHQNQRSMSDPKQKAIMILLSKLWYICYFEGLYAIQCLATTRMVRMAIEHGVHDTSGNGFAAMAMALVGFCEDWEGAVDAAETALLLQQRVQNEYTAALTYFATVSCVFTWTTPLQSCLLNYMDGLQAGMRSGNVMIGTWCILAHHIGVPFILGKPMEILLARVPDVLHQLEEMKQSQQLYHLYVLWQMFLNLSGDSTETKELKGDVFDADQMPPRTPFESFGLHWAKLHLYNHYGDWESGAKLALEFKHFLRQGEVGAADFVAQSFAFHWGLSLYAMARQSKKQKYKRGAKQALNLIGKWVKKGCPNVQHFYTLLRAEQASLDRRYEAAEALYKKAIVMAARPGLVHDAAIFNARYSAFLRQPGPYFAVLEDEAKYRLQESIRYYDEWGAKKIAAMQLGRLQRWQ